MNARVLTTMALWLGACCPPGLPCGPDGGGEGPPRWSAVLDGEDLDGAVLSIWGPSSDTVFGVGGPVGNNAQSLIVRLRDGRWQRLAVGGSETFWWVHGTSASDVWAVGEAGRIVHFDGNGFQAHASGVTATLWGVMAFSPTDVWAVGGTPGDQQAPNDIVLHYDGTAWTPEALPGTPRGASLFKVWGTSGTDLFVVGEYGTIWHRDASGWTLQSAEHTPPLAQGTLFTVHGCGNSDVWAVGGQAVLHYDGTTWSREDVVLPGQVNGVSCSDAGVALVGFGGMKLRRVAGAWTDESSEEPYEDLHAAWFAPDGTLWASGGDWLTPSSPTRQREGLIARYGSGTVADNVSP